MKSLFTLCWFIELGLLAEIISENQEVFQAIDSAALPYAVFFAVIGLASKHWDRIRKLV